MLALKIKANFDQLLKEIHVTTQQLPQATADALSGLAFRAREALSSEMKEKFTLRTPYTLKSLRVKRATKKDWPNPIAYIGSVAPFMGLQTEGGDKVAKNQDVPLGAPINARESKNAAIPHSIWVRNAMKRRKGFFWIRAKDGRRYLIQRLSNAPKGTPMDERSKFTKALYVLEDKVKIKKRIQLLDVVNESVRRNYKSEFLRAIEYAYGNKK